MPESYTINYYSMKLFHLFGAVALLLIGCSGNKAVKAPAPTTGDLPLEGTYWVLVELEGKAVGTPAQGEKPSFVYFDAGKSLVSLSGGCNVMGGSYRLLEGYRIEFGNLISTMMACPNMENEDGLKRMAGLVDNYAIHGDNLMFAKARMAPVARFKAATPPAGLKLN